MGIELRKTKYFFKGGCSAKRTIIPFVEIFEEDIFDEDGNKEGNFKTLAIDFWVKWLDDGRHFAGGYHFQKIFPIGILK